MPFAQIKHIQVFFGSHLIIEDFSLSINEGEIYSIIGPSGCGKSTLLKTLGGIIRPARGEALINNEKINSKQHKIGYIPQHYGLLNWLKVKDNLLIGEKIKHTENLNREEIIEKLGISDLLDRYPRSLSGGQQQRVALARAWVLNPQLLLMDEPFSALDTFTSESSKKLFLQLWKQQKTTTLFVTHNVREAVELGKHIVLLSELPTRILQVISNPLFEKGASRSEDDFYRFSQTVKTAIQQAWGTEA